MLIDPSDAPPSCPPDTAAARGPRPAEEMTADIVALVGSRLCHDLISPLGAISNGVELLAMTGAGTSPEVQLIAEAVAAANARIKFFRVAFGQAGDQRVGRTEIAGLLAEMSQGGRLKYDWQIAGDQPRRLAKLAFLALLCLETALPWGGEVVISEAGGIWRIAAQARRTKADPALWSRLDGGPGTSEGADLGAAQVQFALLPREARALGRKLSWRIDETGAAIGF